MEALFNNVTRLTFHFLFSSPPNPSQRIVGIIHDTFLQRNNAIVRDVNVLGTDLRATFGDIAQADVQVVLENPQALARVERVHVEAGHADHEARSAK